MDCFPARRALVSATTFAETFHKTPALVSYRVRCGKAHCRCTTGELHGPYWFLRWRDGDRQRRRYVKAGELDAVRAIVERRQSEERARRIALASALTDLQELNRWLRQTERDLFG